MTKRPAPEEIDILQMELDQRLPHWLDPQQKNPEAFQKIRERNRAKWLAKRRAERAKKQNS